MIIYLVVFALSIISTYIAEKGKKKYTFKIFSLIAILLPSILAGVRAETVGTDINYYAKDYYNKALEASNLFSFIFSEDCEIGYLSLTYIVTFFTKNFHCLLFSIQLIITACVYYFSYCNREKTPMFMSMTVFLLYFYNINLNIMRQGIAVGIFLCSIFFVENKKYKKAFVILFISILFHKSAVLGLPIYALFYIEQNKNFSSNTKVSLFYFIIVFFVASILFVEGIVGFLVRANIIPIRYYYYISGAYFSGDNYEFNYVVLIYKVFWCVVAFITYLKDKKELNPVYFIMLIMDMIIFCLTVKVRNIDRIGYYFCIPGMLVCIPKIRNLFRKDSFNRIASYIIIVGILLSYWYMVYVRYNWNATYPFEFFK